MIKKFKIGKTNFTWVVRTRWENYEHKIIHDTYWNSWKLGLFYKQSKMVGEKDFNKPKRWSNNLVNSYMIGMHLLWIHSWLVFDRGVKKLEINLDN